jgi:hypothetical protein
VDADEYIFCAIPGGLDRDGGGLVVLIKLSIDVVTGAV